MISSCGVNTCDGCRANSHDKLCIWLGDSSRWGECPPFKPPRHCKVTAPVSSLWDVDQRCYHPSMGYPLHFQHPPPLHLRYLVPIIMGLQICTAPPLSQQQHPPIAENNSPFILYSIAGNISKCGVCGNKYNKPVLPPHDICIKHREWRTFTPGGIPQSKYIM